MGAYAFEVEGVRLDRMAAFGHLSRGSRVVYGCFWSFSLHPVDGRVAKHGR